MPDSSSSAVESLTFLVSIEDDVAAGSEKGIFGRAETSLRQIPVATLQENLTETIRGLRELFEIESPQQAKFPLKQVQVSFEVTATGKVALLGTSAEVSGRGAITLTFGT